MGKAWYSDLPKLSFWMIKNAKKENLIKTISPKSNNNKKKSNNNQHLTISNCYPLLKNLEQINMKF